CLSLFQLLPAGLAELHSFFEQIEGALQRQVAALHLLYDLFQLVESSLEAQGRLLLFRHLLILAGDMSQGGASSREPRNSCRLESIDLLFAQRSARVGEAG